MVSLSIPKPSSKKLAPTPPLARLWNDAVRGIGKTGAFDPKRTWRPLFLDHLVGAGEDRRRHGEADRFVSRKIDGQLERVGCWNGRGVRHTMPASTLCRARSITRRRAVSEQRPEMRAFAGWP